MKRSTIVATTGVAAALLALDRVLIIRWRNPSHNTAGRRRLHHAGIDQRRVRTVDRRQVATT